MQMKESGMIGSEETSVDDQDRAFDMFNTFEKYGYVMFPQQRDIYDFIANRIVDKNVLEAGCGNGIGTAILERKVGTIVGTDVLPRNIEFASVIYPWITFLIWDILHPSSLMRDCVVCIEAFEHVIHPLRVLENLISAARESVWISTPNALVRIQPSDNPFHIAEYTPQQMLEMIREVAPKAKVTIYGWESMMECSSDTNDDPLLYHLELEKS